MATGTIKKPYAGEAYTEYNNLTKASKTIDATNDNANVENYTITRYHLCKSGETGYFQIVLTAKAAATTDSATIFHAMPVKPKFNVEGKVGSGYYGADFNWSVKTNGDFVINRSPKLSSDCSVRVNVSYPIV